MCLVLLSKWVLSGLVPCGYGRNTHLDARPQTLKSVKNLWAIQMTVMSKLSKGIGIINTFSQKGQFKICNSSVHKRRAYSDSDASHARIHYSWVILPSTAGIVCCVLVCAWKAKGNVCVPGVVCGASQAVCGLEIFFFFFFNRPTFPVQVSNKELVQARGGLEWDVMLTDIPFLASTKKNVSLLNGQKCWVAMGWKTPRIAGVSAANVRRKPAGSGQRHSSQALMIFIQSNRPHTVLTAAATCKWNHKLSKSEPSAVIYFAAAGSAVCCRMHVLGQKGSS